jgi:hypothetical protein
MRKVYYRSMTITGGHMSRLVISATVLSVLLLAGLFLAPRAAAETEIAQVVTTAVTAQVDTADSNQEPSLPEGLSRIFASLGLFIVTMFTMAIGTEIMVDVFKLLLGLKSKPSAMRTIREYEALLPGKLNNLGLAAEAQLQVQNQLAASAGSSFWHDQLNRLQAVKKSTESAYAALQPIIISQQNERET